MNDFKKLPPHTRLGNALIRFSGSLLLISSLVKFAHSAKPVAYMNFLGYEDEKMFLIAGLEMLGALLFLRQATRSAGLLLVSSYLGGAIAAHLASHPLNGNTPIVIFMFHHSYLGTLPAIVVLACAWIGVKLAAPRNIHEFRSRCLAPVAGQVCDDNKGGGLALSRDLPGPTPKKDGLEVRPLTATTRM